MSSPADIFVAHLSSAGQWNQAVQAGGATAAVLNGQGLTPGLYLVRCGSAISRLVIQ